MAPPRSSNNPPPSSQAKKQASISSFFTQKAPPTPKDPAPRTANDSDNDDPLYTQANSSLNTNEQRRGKKRGFGGGDSNVEKISPPVKKTKIPGPDDDIGHLDTDDGGAYKVLGRSFERTKAAVVNKEARKTVETKITDRTSKYMFSSSPAFTDVEMDDENDDAGRHRRQVLHEKFVKKLGRPESMAEIKCRNHIVGEETQEADGGEESDEEEEAPKPTKGRSGAAPAKKKLTPMLQQIVDLKLAHMDTLLIVEVGYKCYAYGRDAEIASKELGFVCSSGRLRYDDHPSEAHIDQNRFARCMIPLVRLNFHVKRLVQAGHKVGVVRQLETAALKKVGNNRNTPFVRQLTNVYTKATYVDDVDGLETNNVGGALATGFLLCLTESNAKGWGADEKVHVGIVAVQPATGDIVYDDFEDGFMRSEIETRLLHIAPSEFLIVGDLSRATDKVIKYLAESKTNVFGDQARVERVPKSKSAAAESFSNVSNFYADKMKLVSSTKENENKVKLTLLDKAHNLSELVTVCLSAMIEHMKEYGLEHVFELTKNFQPFSARSHMLLNGNTLSSLEIYQNQTDHTGKGSLFWTMDRTKTRFGNRLLRKWIGRPLLDRAQLEERISAVQELKEGERTVAVDKLNHLLSNIKFDLERSLIRIYYTKCTRPELLNVFQTLQRISSEYLNVKDSSLGGFNSAILNNAIAALPKIHEEVVGVLEKINLQSAREDDKYTFFREEWETEDIKDHSMGIAAVEAELDEHRKVAAQKIGKSQVSYVTVAANEYLIEVENDRLKRVPASWVKISGTKKLSRFHTPEVVRMVRERDLHRESLAAACDTAFKELLVSISAHYQEFRDCIQSLATLDCLLSLADLATSAGYVKPTFTDEIRIYVEEGRHPMVEQLLLDAYVPNDIDLNSSDPNATRALLITGPNMGGKSSYVRQVALICIMGQIGSYVPATSAELGMLDAVFTRMGAFDNMMAGESTFMVELSETADILKQATPRSLVLLDELGRGTSTHDGVAIAEAVLRYVIADTGCLCAFITHYQHLARLEREFGGALKNVHMRFREEEGVDGEEGEITFLYEVGKGVAHRSYGLNVARLANVPRAVLEVASVKSREMEESVLRRKVGYLASCMSRALADGGDHHLFESFVRGLEEL